MRKLKIYLDTSVISHLFADDVPQKKFETEKFWGDIVSGKYDVFLSDTTITEIERNKEPLLSKLRKKLDNISFALINETDEISSLANLYISGGVLKQKNLDDCMHIASAVVTECDIIVSWNFKDFVNIKTIDGVKIVNTVNNYKEIRIMSPNMLIGGEYGDV